MKTAIITLDLINDICHEKGKLAKYADRIENKNIINKMNQLTAWGRHRGELICHVRVGFNAHYKDGSSISPLFSGAKANNALALNAWGGDFCQTLNREADDVNIIKHRVSAFYGTDLDLILRANRIEKLILAGVSTSNAVELTAREAHDRDYQVTIVTDACEADTDEVHEASLRFLSRIARLLTVKELIL
ncbi:cysteine hydrolase family protein [Shewanella surugensis]|uniref:Cysteine hydrolase n=1 Tax=Shewanella surugensis TaxID=212020 RepID=A0ABT0LIQ6_9GAMM|nr:isochorismatase family cysteine hydrolase [Shewanella surugensis]MCL1127583.1 cysteine hydrolase [Shewanella surugensis]